MAEAPPSALPDPSGGGAEGLPPPLVSVVLPMRNEAPNAAPLLAEVAAALEGVPHEVVCVDDGSADGTAEAVREAARRAPPEGPVRLLRHPRPRGQSAALASGVGAARAAWVATLDGDGQNDPADLPRLWARARAEGWGTMVVGHRVARRDTRVKRLTSRVANRVRAALLGDATPDTGCGLKVFPRALFLDLPRFDHMHRFLPALVLRGGGRVVSEAVGHRPRLGGRSNYGTLDRLAVGVVDLFGMIWLQRRAMRGEVSEEALGPASAGEAPRPFLAVERPPG